MDMANVHACIKFSKKKIMSFAKVKDIISFGVLLKTPVTYLSVYALIWEMESLLLVLHMTAIRLSYSPDSTAL